MDHLTTIRDALMRGDWSSVHAEASAWAKELEAGARRDPRAQFALNVGYLLKGEFKEALKTHAEALQEAEDIELVRTWTDALLKEQPENANVQLVAGLFLSQSGQSEQSINRYKEAIRLDPRAAYPHYFLGQIHERADRKSVV